MGLEKILSATALVATLHACAVQPAPTKVMVPLAYHALQTQDGGMQGQTAPAATDQMQAGTSAQLTFPFLKDVGLSATQTSNIQAIVQKYQPPEQAQSAPDSLRTLLLAPKVDRVKLLALLKADIEKRDELQKQSLQMLADVRNVLTPAQQQSAAASIQQSLDQAAASPAPPADQAQPNVPPSNESPPPGPQLNLTPTQQALFQAAAPAAPAGGPQTQLTALAAFLVSGDSEALATALAAPGASEKQLAATVDAYASLSAAQRQTLVNYQPPAPPSDATQQSPQVP